MLVDVLVFRCRFPRLASFRKRWLGGLASILAAGLESARYAAALG